MTPSEYEGLKRKYETLKAQAAKAEGAREQLLSTLAVEFDVKGVDEALAYLDKLKNDLEVTDAEFSEATDELKNLIDRSVI